MKSPLKIFLILLPFLVLYWTIFIIAFFVLSWKIFDVNYILIIKSIFNIVINNIENLSNYVAKYDHLFRYLVYWISIMLAFFLFKKSPWILYRLVINYLYICFKIPFYLLFKWNLNNSKNLIIDTYINFLKRYYSSEKDSIKYILKSHMFLFWNLFKKNFSVKDEELLIFKAPFEYKNIINGINSILLTKIWAKNHIRKNFIFNENFTKFYVSKWNETSLSLGQKLLNIKDEILLKMWLELSSFSVKNEWFDDIAIEINNQDSIWDSKVLDIDNFKINKWELLLWFFPINSNNNIVYDDYKISISNLIHSIVIWVSRSWKDVLVVNFIHSILKNIKYYKNIELHFFDTKGSDWVYLSNMTSYWIFRHHIIEKYPLILEKIENEMNQRQNEIWIESNIINYNLKNPWNILKEKIIIINEFTSLTTSYDKVLLNKFFSHLNNIISRWASAWIKIIIMTHTIKKSLNPNLSKILVNIESKFILKINDKEEILTLSKWLSNSNLMDLKKYNCLQVVNYKLIKEFKPYLITQKELKQWVNKNFQIVSRFNNQKIDDYYNYLKKSWKISMKEAISSPFNLTRNEWNILIDDLEKNDEITRKSDNSIHFKS